MFRLFIFVIFLQQAGGKAGKDSKQKAKAISRSARAGLQVSSTIFIDISASNNSICSFIALFFLRLYYFLITGNCNRVTDVMFRFLAVSSRSYPQALKNSNNKSWTCRSNSSRIQRSNFRIFNSWGKISIKFWYSLVLWKEIRHFKALMCEVSSVKTLAPFFNNGFELSAQRWSRSADEEDFLVSGFLLPRKWPAGV